jgi:hypothetical protein
LANDFVVGYRNRGDRRTEVDARYRRGEAILLKVWPELYVWDWNQQAIATGLWIC